MRLRIISDRDRECESELKIVTHLFLFLPRLEVELEAVKAVGLARRVLSTARAWSAALELELDAIFESTAVSHAVQSYSFPLLSTCKTNISCLLSAPLRVKLSVSPATMSKAKIFAMLGISRDFGKTQNDTMRA